MSIDVPREQWKPTMSLRWAPKLQQMWWREVGEYSEFWKRTLWKPEYEWRDVPIEQPASAPETGTALPYAGNVPGSPSQERFENDDGSTECEHKWVADPLRPFVRDCRYCGTSRVLNRGERLCDCETPTKLMPDARVCAVCGNLL
jgi:hypothetical protein